MNYFLKRPDGKKILVQFKAMWRSMTQDEREAWAQFVESSQDKHTEPLKAFLKWREEQS